MKKSIQSVLFFILSTCAYAQTQIINGDFEDWYVNEYGISSPVGWEVINLCSTGTGIVDSCIITAEKNSSEVVSGNYALSVHTDWGAAKIVDTDPRYTYMPVSGFLRYGHALNINPKSVKGFGGAVFQPCYHEYMYIGNENDITFNLYSNGVTVATTTVSDSDIPNFRIGYTDSINNGLKYFESNFVYTNPNATVDSLSIEFPTLPLQTDCSSGYGVSQYILVDHIQISDQFAAINKNTDDNHILFHIESDKIMFSQYVDQVQLISYSGIEIKRADEANEVNISDVQNGVYIVKYISGDQVYSGKVLIAE